ncbi:LAMI_0D11958g1_1 [Lachancea mirantina]|uniref:LAMI_0D11958g1_1 n=1 Tax=Lachancea mirantina TaxID=1230905 RepID=A0A1G4JFA0_9SACH|nr:LAMI_0D11958g1_1 [Lachancea mirantina]
MEAQGPLDVVPEENYPPLITQANYLSTKQLIDQVLSEDQEYVAWKLKDMRTGGTMNGYLKQYLEYSGDSDGKILVRGEDGIDMAQFDRLQKLERRDGALNRDDGKFRRRNGGKISKPAPGSHIVEKLRFPREVYDEQLRNLPHGRELDQSEQLNLLVTNLDEDQMNRFEVFRRTSLAKNNVKKISGLVTGQTVAANINLLLAGVGKILVGEMVEKALEVKKKMLVALMLGKFREKEVAAHRLKKSLKKLTMMVEGAEHPYEDSVDEAEEDFLQEGDEEEQANEIVDSNQLLKSHVNSEEIRRGIIKHYNKLVKRFNALDVSIEKYSDSPLLPEHIREAWRLYRTENDTVPQATWRTQGECNGWMFR